MTDIVQDMADIIADIDNGDVDSDTFDISSIYILLSRAVGEDREPSTVLTSWPTYEAAVIDRPTWAIEHEYVINRWIPKVKNDGYTVIEIRYREVQVPYIPTK